MLKPLALATATLASVVAFLPGTASACSCMEPGATFLNQPEDGATGVPTNALIWVGGSQTRGLFDGETQHPIELVDPEGVALPGTEGRLRSTNDTIDVFTPDLLLAANTTYEVRVADQVLSTFTTGSSTDDEPPAVPAETDRHTWSNPADPFGRTSCGPTPASHGVSLTWDMGDDSVLVLLDRDGLADVDTDLIEGSASGLAPHGSVSMGNGFVCGGDTWPEARLGAETDVQYGSFDLAGNFSGWSEAETVTVRASSGCSTAGGSAPTSLIAMLALLGLVAVRRR